MNAVHDSWSKDLWSCKRKSSRMYRGINTVARAQKFSSKGSISLGTNSSPSKKIGYAQVYSYSCFPTAAGKDTVFRQMFFGWMSALGAGYKVFFLSLGMDGILYVTALLLHRFPLHRANHSRNDRPLQIKTSTKGGRRHLRRARRHQSL